MLEHHGKAKMHAIHTAHRYDPVNTDGDHRRATSSQHVVFTTASSQRCIINMVCPTWYAPRAGSRHGDLCYPESQHQLIRDTEQKPAVVSGCAKHTARGILVPRPGIKPMSPAPCSGSPES